jgi:putative restriction endonuclease
MRISDFFENLLGANLANARWSWGAANPTTNQLFLRVWTDDLELVDGLERVSILTTNWRGTSAGLLERKRHITALRNGAEGYGVLCTPKPGSIPGSREIAKFDDEFLLKFGEIIEEGNRVYAMVIDRIPVEKLSRAKTSHSLLVPDLKSIFAAHVDATIKEALVNARVGQGTFRAQVLQIWGSRCCVTGSSTIDVIRASHIKPWRDSNNCERLDPYNGLPLVATLDALFDAGLITFADDGALLVSQRLSSRERELLAVSDCQLLQQPHAHTSTYIKYHRDFIFIDTKSRNTS